MGIADGRNVYIGRLDNKKDHSTDMYHRQGGGPPMVALGGYGYNSYNIRHISLLIHWDKDVRTSKQATYGLYGKLKNVSSLSIGGTPINYIVLQVPEPVDVGTDDNGVYECVIWLGFVCQRK